MSKAGNDPIQGPLGSLFSDSTLSGTMTITQQ